MSAGAIVEEIAKQNAARRLIGLDTDKTPEGRVRRMRGLGQLAFDALRMDVIAALHRVPDRQLAIMVIRQRESHHAFEGEITGTELLDDLGRDTSEFQTAAHQVDGDAELQRDLVFTAPFADHFVEGLKLIGGMHRSALEVFGGGGEDSVALIFDEAGHRMISRNVAVLSQLLQRLETSTAGIDRKTCL